MGDKRLYKVRKSGGGRKKLKSEFDAGKNPKEQMDAAVAKKVQDTCGCGLCWCEIQNLLWVAILL